MTQEDKLKLIPQVVFRGVYAKDKHCNPRFQKQQTLGWLHQNTIE